MSDKTKQLLNDIVDGAINDAKSLKQQIESSAKKN